MTDALARIQALLDTGRYHVTGVRELPRETAVGTTWAAVVERMVDDPDDTTECVYVELKTEQELRWTREKLGSAPGG